MSEHQRIIVSLDVTELVERINDLYWEKEYYEMTLEEKVMFLIKEELELIEGDQRRSKGQRPFRSWHDFSLSRDYPHYEELLKGEGHELIPICTLPSISYTDR